MKIKWALDNEGDIVIADDKSFIGFAYKHPSNLLSIDYDFSAYLAHTDDDIKELGIDKITDWKEYDTESDQ